MAVNFVLKPARWVPPSWVKMLLQKPRNIFLKGVHKLQGHLYLHLVHRALEIDGIVDRGLPVFNSFT